MTFTSINLSNNPTTTTFSSSSSSSTTSGTTTNTTNTTKKIIVRIRKFILKINIKIIFNFYKYIFIQFELINNNSLMKK